MAMTTNPMARGGALALVSATAFGLTTPLVQHLGRSAGAFGTAALLYLGAASVAAIPAVVVAARARSWSLGARDLGRVAVVALCGAFVAPVALAWGLQRTSGVTASLLLGTEATFTVLLARAVWREPIGSRVAVAAASMLTAGALLAGATDGASLSPNAGALAIVVAAAAWAADNVVGRPLADREGAQVVATKAVAGAAISVALARATGEPWPRAFTTVALFACGAVGYGASLRLYLGAQRSIGAARTGSIFAAAPFLGAGAAWLMGERASGAATVGAGVLCAFGVWLHLTERHDHEHSHESVEHDHPHGHDDGHHDHAHDVAPRGAHSHPHRHDAVTHAHAHAVDVHHRHPHRAAR